MLIVVIGNHNSRVMVPIASSSFFPASGSQVMPVRLSSVLVSTGRHVKEKDYE